MSQISPARIIRTILSVALCAVILTVAFVAKDMLASKDTSPQRVIEEPDFPAVSVVSVTRQTYTEILDGFGTVRALKRTAIPSEVAGRVIALARSMEPGTVVTAGTELLRIDARDAVEAQTQAAARRLQAIASLEQAQVTIKSLEKQLVLAREEQSLSEDQLARFDRSAKGNAVSPFDVEAQRLAVTGRRRIVAQLEGQIDATTAEIARWNQERDAALSVERRAERDLLRYTIAAPYSGTIEERFVEPDGWVSTGMPLFTLVDDDTLEIAIALPAHERAAVKPGSEARVRLRAGEPPIWTGTVKRLSTNINPADRTFSAYLVIEGARKIPGLAPGSFVLAEIEGRRHDDCFVVPRRAFVGDHLYVVERLGPAPQFAVARVRKPAVRALLSDVAIIESGLKDRNEVILGNVEQAAEGAMLLIPETEIPGAASFSATKGSDR